MRLARQWEFIADMNHGGTVTISDFWLDQVALLLAGGCADFADHG